MSFSSVRIFFDSLEAAAEALLLVLEDARVTDRHYSFGTLSTSQILQSGLILIGDLEEILPRLETIPGATRYDE